MSKNRKRAKEVIDWAEGRGWKATRTKKGHLRFEKPGHPVVFAASTPSDHRAEKNFRAMILRFERQVEEAQSDE